METLLQRKSPKEFSELAAGLVCDQEPTIPKAANGLSTSDETGADTDSPATPVTDLDDEVLRLRRELVEIRIECDILKQTLAYFAKAQLPGGGS